MMFVRDWFGLKMNRTGGDHCGLHLSCFIFMCGFAVNKIKGQTTYKGVIDYDFPAPNQFFTMDDEGNIALGSTFTEGHEDFYIDPTGNLLVGLDEDFATTKTLKWYRIEDDGFVESPDQLPVDHFYHPVYWSLTPYRVVAGSRPLRVWSLDPLSLEAAMISELDHPDITSNYAAIFHNLDYLYLKKEASFRQIATVQYDHVTGFTTGPVTLTYTPDRGNRGLLAASNKRLLIELSLTQTCTIFSVDDNGDLTVTQNIDLNQEFDMRNGINGVISPDERYLFISTHDDTNVSSFEITTSGTLEFISGWTGFSIASSPALTPDGKFLVVAYGFCACQPAAYLAVFAVGKDGALDYLEGKDVDLQAHPADLAFFPPRQPIPHPMIWRMH